MAYPPIEEIEKLGDRGSFELIPIGRTVTDADGNYIMRADPSVDLDKFTAENGTIDVSLAADTAGGHVAQEATIPRTGLTAGYGAATIAPSSGNTMPQTLDLKLQKRQSATVATQSIDALRGDEQPSMTASSTYLGPKKVRIGFVNRAYGTEAKFTYVVEATSTLGVGVNYGNGWSTSGSVSRSSGATGYTPWYQFSGSSKWVRTKYRYSRYSYPTCTGYTTKVRAGSHYGGFWTSNTSLQSSANVCAKHSAGTGWTVYQGRAAYNSTGAKLSSEIGIDLSSRTGHSSKAKYSYKFRRTKNLCGQHNPPGGHDRPVGNIRVRSA